MKERGKFIVFEGIDGSGKSLQSQLLYKRLKKTKKRILFVDFPRYDEPVWGRLIGEFLRGKFGTLKDVDPHLALLPYMIDEYVWSRDIGRPFLDSGGTILSNRYFTSNVHQIAKLNTLARKKFRDWLWKAGYENLGILRPDLVIFLDLPPKHARKLFKKRAGRVYLNGKKFDIAERDWDHQTLAYSEYLKTLKNNHYWARVPCLTDGRINLPKNIHKRVWEIVSKTLGLQKGT